MRSMSFRQHVREKIELHCVLIEGTQPNKCVPRRDCLRWARQRSICHATSGVEGLEDSAEGKKHKWIEYFDFEKDFAQVCKLSSYVQHQNLAELACFNNDCCRNMAGILAVPSKLFE